MRNVVRNWSDIPKYQNFYMTTKILTFLFFLGFVCSCDSTQNKHTFENKSQEKFDNLLKETREKEYSQPNDIQKKEFLANFDSSLNHFILLI